MITGADSCQNRSCNHLGSAGGRPGIHSNQLKASDSEEFRIKHTSKDEVHLFSRMVIHL